MIYVNKRALKIFVTAMVVGMGEKVQSSHFSCKKLSKNYVVSPGANKASLTISSATVTTGYDFNINRAKIKPSDQLFSPIKDNVFQFSLLTSIYFPTKLQLTTYLLFSQQ